MTGQTQRTGPDALRACWSRWTAIVALFARRRPARRRIDPRAYAALRQELLAACRSCATADDKKRRYYAELEEIVRPWMELNVFNRTDREILSALLKRCREVERHVTGRRWTLSSVSEFWRAPAIAFAGAVWVLVMVWVLQLFGFSVLEYVRDWANLVWVWIKYTDRFQQMSVIAVAFIIVAMYAVNRSVRAWR
jgi:hypothetical protein